MLDDSGKIRLSYHFQYNTLMDALLEGDEARVEREYKRLKAEFKNVIKTLYRDTGHGRTMTIMNEHSPFKVKRLSGFPKVISDCEDMQDRALSEIIIELEEEDIYIGESIEGVFIEWNFGRARETLERLGFDPRELPEGDHTCYSKWSAGKILLGTAFHIFRPDGRVEVMAELPFKIGDFVKSSTDKGFLWLLIYIKHLLNGPSYRSRASEIDNIANAIGAGEGIEHLLKYGYFQKLYPELADLYSNDRDGLSLHRVIC
jgi:hypothetical protein